MKNLTVRYFAMFREHAGISEETLELDAETAINNRLDNAPDGRIRLKADDTAFSWNLGVLVEPGHHRSVLPPCYDAAMRTESILGHGAERCVND